MLTRSSSPASALKVYSQMMVFSILPRQLDCVSLDKLVYTLLTGVTGSSTECLGIHLGNPQTANLGDGNGNVNQTMELRENLIPIGGTCLESLVGGNHLRMFRQNGSEHNTGALFLACVTYSPPPAVSSLSYQISCSVSKEEVAQHFSEKNICDLLPFSRVLSRITRSFVMAMILAGEQRSP
jgi:hypothetical protein